MTVLRNPVIRGFAPDPSLVRVGDWYYVATSSFEWFPTIPIHRSRDLAHWQYAGHVRGAVPGDSLAGVPDSGGVWAPSLSWDGERFWMVYSVVRSVGTPYFDLDTYVCTATDVSGTWSAPRRVASHGFDPALFHHEGRLWLLNMQSDHRPGGRRFAGIVLTELDRRTLAPSGATHLLLQHERLIEGPKLVHRDGWYHLVLAEGGTGVEHGVLVARSRAITGPYELDRQPLLTTRDDPSVPLQKAGHAELVQTPDGDWVMSHLAARPLRTAQGPRCPLGRETAVQALTWDEDGWPRLRDGGWHPAVEVDVPTRRQELAAAADTGEPLGWPWSTLREPADPSWADTVARPGWIRLRGRHGPESWWAHSLLAQRITEHRAEAEVTVEARPRTFTQAAGLVLWYNTEAYHALDLTWAEPEGAGQHGQQWEGGGRTVLSLVEREEGATRTAAVVEVDADSPLTLGVTVDGVEARFWYVREGVRTPVGPPLDFGKLSDDHGSRLRFTGAMAGVHAVDLVDGAFTADFTGFRLTCW
ncbi:family 43 glycosylhydrolase [Streptomyces resistomycificus]|uniref:Xylan 1,4-beta-xylosidase n=1 Tax=Streptomyces resistomycificus TaxID=67356 RepID=A0A0L8L3I5_9ACTN|nr:family 43 glycosylhydrolase [Streptomyces resistomycificus]KOG32675.1 xylan 1,4-beta-xylosidase [Streptomyces resistomycificus]KUO01131.1 xylan 1,4-beta-xylosidase [Streptomyces resistomycificus]